MELTVVFGYKRRGLQEGYSVYYTHYHYTGFELLQFSDSVDILIEGLVER
jgi:hypothetical protein